MHSTRRLIGAVAAALIALALAAAPVVADGDPASDVLLVQRVFYPYTPPVSARLQRTLDRETAAGARQHFPIKVALIDSPADLGAVPSLFGKPQRYAEFLDQEISFQTKQPLLVVMPSGYGSQGLSPVAAAAARSLAKPGGSQSDDLARAAIHAVGVLAAAAGHRLDTSGNSSTASGSSTLTFVIVALAAVAAAAALIAVRNRPRRDG